MIIKPGVTSPHGRSLPGGLSGEIFDGGEPFEAVKKVQSATTRCVVNLTILSPLPPPSLYSFPGSSHTDYDEIQRAAKERADIVARYDLVSSRWGCVAATRGDLHSSVLGEQIKHFIYHRYERPK